jgi:hypothetical protein
MTANFANKELTIHKATVLSVAEEMSEKLEHRAGSKIGHVDALSRHVGAVMDGLPSKDMVLREQRNDSFVASKNREIIPALVNISWMRMVSCIGVGPTISTN